MAKHVWQARNLTPRVIAEGMRAFRYARLSVDPPKGIGRRGRGSDGLTIAIAFAGYTIETKRQKGDFPRMIENLYRAACRTNFRFASGSNGANYIRAGRMVLIAATKLAQVNATLRDLTDAYLAGDENAFAIYDQLLQAGHYAAPYFAENVTSGKHVRVRAALNRGFNNRHED
jgi:hypothetical protein